MQETPKGFMRFPCECGHEFVVPVRYVGRRAKCRKCGKVLTVPAQGEASPAGPPGLKGEVVESPPPDPQEPPPPPPREPTVIVIQNHPAPPPPPPPAPTGPLEADLHVQLGSPTMGEERVIWQGRGALAYHLPGFVWCGLGILLCLVLAVLAAVAASWLEGVLARAVPSAADILDSVSPVYFSLLFVVAALWGGWRLVRRVLAYLHAHYTLTTQRIRLREGIFSRQFTQIELFRIKDFAVEEPLFGRLFGYAHVRIVSSDRMLSDVALYGLPGGVKTAEQMRRLAHQARSQAGMTAIHE